jgi:hypothetical protein
MPPKGVMVATDKNLEWMLPWWIYHFKKHCDLPIAFVDLGMSEEKKTFCKDHGTLIGIEPKEFAFDPNRIKELTNHGVFDLSNLSNVLATRNAWLLKPFALLASPFKKTLWMDIDCEVLQSIDNLFSDSAFVCLKESEASLETNIKRKMIPQMSKYYSSGLMLYEKNHPVLLAWAKELEENPGYYLGDQTALSVIIHNFNYSIDTFSEEEHRLYNEEIFESTIICHYYGIDGKKEVIRKILTSMQ